METLEELEKELSIKRFDYSISQCTLEEYYKAVKNLEDYLFNRIRQK